MPPVYMQVGCGNTQSPVLYAFWAALRRRARIIPSQRCGHQQDLFESGGSCLLSPALRFDPQKHGIPEPLQKQDRKAWQIPGFFQANRMADLVRRALNLQCAETMAHEPLTLWQKPIVLCTPELPLHLPDITWQGHLELLC